MQRCLQLAKNGLGSTYPNPMVGCVIVHKDMIIGEGWHLRAGSAHAEVNAIESVKDESLLKDSELYVNLEPCSHQGRTPPCADLIIEKEIPRVYIGSLDDNPLVGGRGVERLEKNGIKVETGVLERECRLLNKRFFAFHQKKRPYIILKWAESADGFIFPSEETSSNGGPVWISNIHSRQLVHKWRAEEASILVGTRTVEQDDPALTVRDFKGSEILRLVIDRKGKLNPESNVFKGTNPTVVFTDGEKAHPIFTENKGKYVHFIPLEFDKNLPEQIANHLFEAEIQSLIVEGGAVTLNSFIDAGLWDEARVFRGSGVFNHGIEAPKMTQEASEEQDIHGDLLLRFFNRR